MAEVMNTPFGDVDTAAIDAATEAATAERPKIEEIREPTQLRARRTWAFILATT